MKIQKFLSSSFYSLLALISKILPKWNQAEVIEVFPPIRNYKFNHPKNIKDFKFYFANFFVTNNDFPEFRILLLKNVYVIGAGVVFKNLRIFHPSLAWDEDYYSFRHGSILFKQWSSDTSVAIGNIGLVYNVWASKNYYHWIIDSIPRMLLLRKKYSNITLILPAHIPDYMKSSMEILGFNSFIQLKPDQAIKVTRLLFPELTSNIEYQHPILINEVRDTFYEKFNLDTVKPNRLIYVSRNKQLKRLIHNEKELLLILKKFEFETVYFEEMEFYDQVQMMAQTKIILSVHGANLTNILFMHPMTTVIELMNKDFNNLTYFNLSSVLNLNYYCVPCKPKYDDISNINYIIRNNASIKVDLVKIETILNNIIT